MNSLRDQLLKAGLVTQEQVDQAALAKPSRPKAAHQPTGTPCTERPAKQPKDGQRHPAHPNRAQQQRPKSPKTEPSDLEQFYQARAELERQERLAEEQRQREAAARRKQVHEQVANLIQANLQNVEEADIRYNFVIGNNIKYVYVTAQQQQDLADGKLAITFLAGKRCLIPAAIAQQIRELDPDKPIILNDPTTDAVMASDTL